MKKYNQCAGLGLFLALAINLLIPPGILAQNNQDSGYDRDTLITVAKKIMAGAQSCALITLDESGYPQVRTMDPFPPEADLVVWLGTKSTSRKVKEIRNDSRAALYYAARNGAGYVVLKGHAYLINDAKKKAKYWKEAWAGFYTDKNSEYILIKLIPDRLEILDYKHNIIGDLKTWDVPWVEFKSGQSRQ